MAEENQPNLKTIDDLFPSRSFEKNSSGARNEEDLAKQVAMHAEVCLTGLPEKAAIYLERQPDGTYQIISYKSRENNTEDHTD